MVDSPNGLQLHFGFTLTQSHKGYPQKTQDHARLAWMEAKVKELQDAQEALQRSKREKDGLQAELQKAGCVVSKRTIVVGRCSM